MGTHSRGHTLRLIAITLLWTASFLLLLGGTFSVHDEHLAWGLFFANAAIIPTMWEVNTRTAHRHRLTLETLAQIMAEESAKQHGERRGGTVVTLR